MKSTKEIDVIPDTNNGIVKEVINAMFYRSEFSKDIVLKTARWNYYKSNKNNFGSDIFIIFKLYGSIFEIAGTWYGNGDEECWFSDYNWSCNIKQKPTDWDYKHIKFDSPYSFKSILDYYGGK